MDTTPGQQQRLQALIDKKAPSPNPVVASMLDQARELATNTQDLAQRRDAMEQELKAVTAELQRRTGEARRLSTLILEFDKSPEDLLNHGLATPSPAGDDEVQPTEESKET